MKNLLLTLICLPIIGFSQSNTCLDNLDNLQIIWESVVGDKQFLAILFLDGKYEFTTLDGSINTNTEPEILDSNDRWWISKSGKTLNILYNNYITYKFPIGLESTVQKGSWTNLAPNSGEFKILSMDKGIQEYTTDYLCLIKEYVESRINTWQTKSEFEKIATYNQRVNDISRKKMIDLYQKEAFEYYKKMVIDNFYITSITLRKYDAENETFLLETPNEPFLLPVPINEAKSFKENFDPTLFSNLEMVMKDNKFIISNIEYPSTSGAETIILNEDLTKTVYELDKFGNISKRKAKLTESLSKGKPYRYDISENYSYTNTTFDYNFDKIDMDELDISSEESSFSNSITTSNKSIRLGNSFVDSDIPKNKKLSNRYALIIGNEDYKSMQKTLSIEQNVDYAVNDAEIFKEYALKTLGVPEENMHFLLNATSGQMFQEIDLITKIVGKIGTKAELIVYYAGHGFPDEQTKAPYLIPVDVTASNLSSAIKLEDFYTKLSSTNASKVSVFLDACFTGGGRNKSLVSSRGVKVVAKQGSLNGNLVVFSASSGKQSSLPYHDQRHGMFTYHLLKKLKDTKGSTTFGELYSYLEEKVSLESLKVNKMEQDPKINVSNQVKSQWLNWKF